MATPPVPSATSCAPAWVTGPFGIPVTRSIPTRSAFVGGGTRYAVSGTESIGSDADAEPVPIWHCRGVLRRPGDAARIGADARKHARLQRDGDLRRRSGGRVERDRRRVRRMTTGGEPGWRADRERLCRGRDRRHGAQQHPRPQQNPAHPSDHGRKRYRSPRPRAPVPRRRLRLTVTAPRGRDVRTPNILLIITDQQRFPRHWPTDPRLARRADATRRRAGAHGRPLHARVLQHGDVLAEPRDAADRPISGRARSLADADRRGPAT